jgi:outer membrane protein OmpA-like peptidoglycan-associated protein
MELKFLTVLGICLLSYGTPDQSRAQNQKQMDSINKWFDQNQNRTFDIQKPGEIQKPGNIQKAGEIQIPRGIQAIKQNQDPCHHRLTVGADALFAFDKYNLNPGAEQTLKVLGPLIKRLGRHPVAIEGHTDAIGSDAYNQTLSERRAQAVCQWLVQNNFIPQGTTIRGYGKKRPVAANTFSDGSDNPKGRQLNRRVEVIVDTCKSL